MRLDRLKSFALSLPSATVIKQWGENLVFKVGGRMFMIVSIDGEIVEQISFKCSAPDFKRLIEDIDGAVPAPYLARASWVALEDPDALEQLLLEEQIRSSYSIIRAGLPKKTQATLAPVAGVRP